MPERELVLAAAVGFLIVAVGLAAMATAHEQHYRDRRRRLLAARLEGLELRVAAVESILTEDRLT